MVNSTATEPTELRDTPLDLDTAFDEILSRYGKQIFNLVYRYVGDYDDASDLAQDVFVNVYRALPTFRGDCRLFTWLCQIAINVCRSYHRKRQREHQYVGPSLDDPLEDDTGDQMEPDIADPDAAIPDKEYERHELRRVVRKAIASLPATQREVVLLRDIEGLSYQEVSEATGLPVAVVKTRLHRARLSLRKALEPFVHG
ncbi:MAG: RNA polymerase sigma factor [Armatimonadota bacterium]